MSAKRVIPGKLDLGALAKLQAPAAIEPISDTRLRVRQALSAIRAVPARSVSSETAATLRQCEAAFSQACDALAAVERSP